jgi:hypothetical protein
MLWEVEAGDASFASGAATVTDSTGSTYQTVRLGSTPGEVLIRVRVVEQARAAAEFTVHAVDSPEITGLSVTEAQAGDTITIEGSNFLPETARNAVLFSGIRGRVLSVGSGQLTVEIPPCLPTRTVDVSVQLGSVASGAIELSVTDGGRITTLAPGEVLDVDDPSGPGCLRLAGGGQEYLAVAFSAATVGAATHPASFRGVASWSGAQSGPPELGAPAGRPANSLERGTQEAWDQHLRRREAELVEDGRSPAGTGQRAEGSSSVPAVGEERTFNVYNSSGDFDQVVAVVRHVGAQAVLYEDTLAPAGGFTDDDLATFSSTFDETIYPTVTGGFGSPSDLDGNERIAILFTTSVNKLSPRGSDGFVGGFFYGLDLLTDREGSNQGEIFYALVPDPTGEFSDPHPKSQVLAVTPAVLAHEFQHMIHFNERILVGGAAGSEALWLSEGLAQMAEELVARSFGASSIAQDFRAGNLVRAKRYVADPLSVSLIVATGQGTLEERGAGWLYVLYMAERFGVDILARLTSSVRTGIENVEFEADTSWGNLIRDWLAALYLDGRGDYGQELRFGSFGLRSRLLRSDGSDGLQPALVGQADFQHDLDFLSSSARHYIVRPPAGGSVVVRLGGVRGGEAPSGSALGLKIVRLF